MRGYVAGGVPLFLEPYRAGRRAYAAYRAHPPSFAGRAEALALARFHRSADALQPYFEAQIAAVARGDREAAVRNLAAGKAAFDRLRRDEADATAALDRSIAADRASTGAAVTAGRLATVLTGLVLIVAGGLDRGAVRAGGRRRRPGPLGQLDPAAQPARVRRAARARAGRGGRRAAGRALHRPRPLQADQRRAGARGRRPGAGDLRRAAARRPAAQRLRRPAGRR